MGIPTYFVYLIKNYKNLINDVKCIENINNLYIDSNSIIYDVINNLDIDLSSCINDINILIIKQTIIKINNIIKEINPDKCVFIAFDGVPPLAKIYQQRNRRFKTSIENSVLNKTVKYDTCNITPGTNFMELLNKSINTPGCFNFKGNIIISGSNKPDEGEHKIFRYIRDNHEYHKTCNTIIYGIDADLFMLSLSHLRYCKNIYLYRETPVFISSLDIRLQPEKRYVIDIYKLAEKIANKMKDNIYDLYNIIDNYIFICMLLGNDFLPHFISINIRDNAITMLLELYYKLFNKSNESIIKDGNIRWKNFKLFIKHLSDNELSKVKELYKKRNYFENMYKKNNNNNIIITSENYNDIPIWERNIEHFININEECWQKRYYYSLFNIDISDYKRYKMCVNQICTDYISTLEWNFIYYTNNCPDIYHVYKYNYAPLLEDLYINIPLFDIDFIDNKIQEPINCNSLLSFVLPIKNHYLINKNIKKLLDKEYSKYYDDNNINIIYAFCRYTWESHVMFNYDIDIHTLNNKIKLLIK